MINKLITSFLLAIVAIPAFSQPVSESTAREIASSFMAKRSFGGPQSMLILAKRGISNTAPLVYNAPAYYVYQYDGGGFVVISGDQVASPILMYSEDETLDLSSPVIGGLLDWYSDLIYKASKLNLSSISTEEWKSRIPKAESNTGERVELNTPFWHHGYPFNKKLPVDDYGPGGHALVPYLSLYLSLILRYYSWPEAGEGHLNGCPEYGIEGYDLGHKYDWANIPWDSKQTYTQYEEDQLATVVYDLSVATEFINDFYGSDFDAAMKIGLGALVQHFKYDPRIEAEGRVNYSVNEWISLLKDEIRQQRPFFIKDAASITLQDNGRFHYYGSFVYVDGFDENNFFRFADSGTLSFHAWANVAPIIEDNPKLKALYDNQVAYLNIKPNKENASIDVGESKIRVLDQTLITNWFGETNQSFFIGLTYITKDPSGYLLSQDPLPVECAWCLVDKNGMVKDVVSKIVSASAYTLVGRQFECKVTVPIDKTDAIMLCYRKNASAEWVVASHTDKTSIQMSHQRPLSELVSLKYSNYDQALIIEKPAGVIVDMIRTDGTKAGNKYSFDGPSLDYENNKGGYSLSEKKYAIRGNRGETWTVTFHDLNDSFSVDITF